MALMNNIKKSTRTVSITDRLTSFIDAASTVVVISVFSSALA
jgi:hypothetical protein